MSFTRRAYAELFNSASATTVAASSFASAAGRTIIGFVGWEGGNTSVSVSDTAGNTYVVGTPSMHSNNSQVVCGFYCLSSAGNASNVVTVTFGAASSFRVIQVEEYSAGAPVSYDGTNTGHATGTNAVTTGSITTTGSIGLLFAGVKVYNTISTISATAPLTQIAQASTYGATGDRQLSASGSYAATFGSSAGTSLSAVAMAFKEAPSATVTSVTGNTVTEGTPLRFTVTLSGTTAWPTPFPFSWGGTAVNGTDYNNDLSAATFSAGASFVGGQIQFASGYSSCTIDVPTVDNALDQPDCTLILTVGGTASTGGTITDNDAPPVVTFSDGVESFGVVTCVATLGAVSGKTITVDYATADGTKTAGTDYTAASGTLTFAAGETTKTVTVAVL